MSISTFTGIQTSLRGLLAQQHALDVTSHNIANASTVGYTRQEATLAASSPLAVPTNAGAAAGALGTGVDS
jgi:flagellar hook-associated protein 1